MKMTGELGSTLVIYDFLKNYMGLFSTKPKSFSNTNFIRQHKEVSREYLHENWPFCYEIGDIKFSPSSKWYFHKDYDDDFEYNSDGY